MIPPTPATDDLHGATHVVDTNALIDFYSCHSVVEVWNSGAPIDPTRLSARCTRARDGLLLALALHAGKVVTYSLAHETLDKLVSFAPPAVNGIQTAFVRATHLYLREELLRDWVTVNPDEGGPPEPKGTAADKELVRVASEYQLPLITLDANCRKRAIKAGVTVFSPQEYIASTALDMRREWEGFVQRYLAGIPAYASRQPDPAGVENLLRWLLDTFYRGVFARAV